MKIIDKLNKYIRKEKTFYSFEYFPPRTESGLINFYSRIDRMAELHPLFVDITWGAGGTTADLTLEIARNMQNLSGLETMMHLTCTNMPREELARALNKAREFGIQNILALRGDPPVGANEWEACDNGFSYAIDLVRFIREEHGDYFGIGVAGYPYGHEESESFEKDLYFLKQKVDAGADFVITQLFYDVETFLHFYQHCKKIGINCPIIPGVMPIHNYRSFSRMARFCTDIPAEISEAIEARRNDDSAVRAYGLELVSQMCRTLLQNGIPGLHFYTLNLERVVTELLDQLHLVPEQVSREFPWRQSASSRRTHEDVRPIFWANRPKSYLARTMQWDEFPNGRWGDSRSPAFGDIGDYLRTNIQVPVDVRREMWGEAPTSIADVAQVFNRFCKGEIQAIPWFDAPLELETNIIRSQLMRLNQHGLWTINSQPRVNGAPSDDPVVGWGGNGGHVYQKAYVEFFLSGSQIPALMQIFRDHPNISFHAINHEGLSYTNCETVNAVTWGVFPGKEIMQPTIVDPDSFVVWKDEAFQLWLHAWGALYEPESPSQRLIQQIHDTHFLVNVVDNNFVDGNIWSVFDRVIERMAREGHSEFFIQDSPAKKAKAHFAED